MAEGDPFSGYTNTHSYFLPYKTGSFTPENSGDVTVSFTLPYSVGTKTNFTMNVDTGSRGCFTSEDALGGGFTNANSFKGLINLSSSGRVYNGYWTPTTMIFDVTDLTTSLARKVISSVAILSVQSLTCDTNHSSASFSIKSSAPSGGFLNLDGGGTLAYTDWSFSLTYGQSVSYASNPGLLEDVSNFGVGFYLGGATNSTTTGPIANNKNQIYNPLINLTEQNLAAGYIIKTNGIQLGLATNVSGFAYTYLNPTGLTSTNSVPDWQTPMGTTVINGTTNIPGSIVIDSGIGDAYISASGLVDTPTNLTVQLMNSGGATNGGVGYHIDMTGSSSLNPSSIGRAPPATNGIFSQNQSPYGTSYFNTGRNVLNAFDMLYDPVNGYMGLLTNDYGSSLVSDGTVFFAAQAGGYASPIPEPSTYALLLLSGAASLYALKGRKR